MGQTAGRASASPRITLHGSVESPVGGTPRNLDFFHAEWLVSLVSSGARLRGEMRGSPDVEVDLPLDWQVSKQR